MQVLAVVLIEFKCSLGITQPIAQSTTTLVAQYEFWGTSGIRGTQYQNVSQVKSNF